MRLLNRNDDTDDDAPGANESTVERLEVKEETKPAARRETVADRDEVERLERLKRHKRPEQPKRPERVEWVARPARPERVDGSERVAPPERDLVEYRWSPGSALVALAGAALAVVGIVALTRTGINGSWYRPVEQVGGIDHTPLLAAIEVGAGVLLVVVGLVGRRILTGLVCVLAAIAAGVAAVDPAEVEHELAIQRWWAIGLVAGAAGLAVVAMMPWSTRTVERRQPALRRRTRGQRVVEQH